MNPLRIFLISRCLPHPELSTPNRCTAPLNPPVAEAPGPSSASPGPLYADLAFHPKQTGLTTVFSSFRGLGLWAVKPFWHPVRQIRTSPRSRRGFSCAWGLVLCGLRGLGFRVWDAGFEANGLRFKRLGDKAGSADWGFHSFKQAFWMQVLKELAELLWGGAVLVQEQRLLFGSGFELSCLLPGP